MFKKMLRELRPYEAALLVTEETGIKDIVSQFIGNPDLHHLCVIDTAGKLLGLINLKRLFKSIFSHHIAVDNRISNLLSFHTATISSDLMLTHVITATEDDSLDEVIRRMIANNIREIPVLDQQGRVIGFVTLLIIMREWLRNQNDGNAKAE